MRTEILCGNNLPILREMADNSVDAIVTDPPYGLSFMGKRWDYDVPSVELWAECLRVLKPGGHLLAFAGTRTQHRMAVRIEDAGFEIRDMIAWVYGSGFPKSLNIGKAIDKAAGAKREVVGQRVYGDGHVQNNSGLAVSGYGGGLTAEGKGVRTITAPATDAAKQWDGWGSALKPALEPITVARKPLAKRTIAANVLTWGTGGVNVDGCRIDRGAKTGSYPANFIHDGSDEVVRLFPVTASGSVKPYERANRGGWAGPTPEASTFERAGDTGSASRFFYCAKASRSEREAGLEGIEARLAGCMNMRNDNHAQQNGLTYAPKSNHHPTVKPIALMRYLCRLVTPPGGIVLDPFAGSGTTGCAATLEGFDFIGIEREAEYAEIARRRVEHWREVASQDETVIEDVQEKLFAGIG
jgi:site-specific DNA-methyltransferase (adenine-specific)